MKIFVKVKLRAKEARLIKIDDTHFEIAIKEPPIEGRANQAVIEIISDYLKIAKSRISIISGNTSRQKILEIH